MKRPLPIATMVALASCVLASPARADFDRHCEERPLDVAERPAAERAVSAFRAALPAAPAGWTVTKDGERVSAVACEIAGTTWKPGGKLVPQPVSIHVRREYRRPEAPPRAVAEAPPAPPTAAAAPGADPARMKELEARLAELQKSRKDAAKAYQEARQARDGAAQEAARRQDREIALAMRPVQEELSSLRRAEAGARAGQLEAHTAAAFAHARAIEERRTDGAVSITANLASFQARGAQALEPAGADVAIRQSGDVILLLGPWKLGQGETAAVATMDESAPRTRLQTIAVEITGNAATADALRAGVGVVRLRALIGR